jgi:hypothetical protein
MYSPRWHLTPSSTLQDALSLFHFLWRKLPLHMFHEGSLRDFQSMSASSSRSREAILCIWCPSQAQRMIRDAGHALANQNIAVFIFPAPCLALIFDVAFECLRPADSELCGYGIIKLLKQRPYAPFILALFWCPGCTQCLGHRNPISSSRQVSSTLPSQLFNHMQELTVLLRRPHPSVNKCNATR